MEPVILSNEEMDAIHGVPNQPMPMPNSVKMSDDQMNAIHNQEQGGQVVNEMHPDISVQDRMAVKNLLDTNPQAAYRYMKRAYPDADVKVSQDGRIIMKNSNEAKYRGIEHNGIPNSLPEAAMDIGDVPYDIFSGLIQGAASTAAGAAAAGPTAGWGTLPAAMAAGSGAAAGTEALKQKIAQAMGYSQDINPEAISSAAKFGAATPLTFGAGVTSKALQNATPGMKEKLAQALAQSSRGIPQRMYDYGAEKIAPGAMNVMSGVPQGAINALKKHYEQIEKLNHSGVLPYVEQAHEGFTNAFKAKKQELGQDVNKAIMDAGGEIDTAAISKPLDDAIAEATKKYSSLKNSPNKDQLDALKALKDRIFTMPETDAAGKEMLDQAGQSKMVPIPGKLSPETAWNLQDQLRNMADYKSLSSDLSSTLPKKTLDAKKIAAAFRSAYENTNQELSRVSEGLTGEAKDKYKEIIKLENELSTKFSNSENTFKTLSGLDAKSKQALNEKIGKTAQDIGFDIHTPAEVLQAYKYFGKSPELSALSGGGTTSTTRTIPLAAALGYGGFKTAYKMGHPEMAVPLSLAGAKAGAMMGSPAAIKQYTLLGKSLDKNVIQPVGKPIGLLGRNTAPIWSKLQNPEGEQ